MGRRRNATRIISIRCCERDRAAIDRLRATTKLQPSSAARFSMRAVALCDLDATSARDFAADLNSRGKRYNSATHDVNLAVRLLLSPRGDARAAYVQAASRLASAADCYAQLADEFTLSNGLADGEELSESPRLLYVPSTVNEERSLAGRLNFRVDEDDAQRIDEIASSLDVTRTRLVRAVLSLVSLGHVELGESYVLFTDGSIDELRRERGRWATNLSQVQDAAAAIVDGFSRSRRTSMEDASEINALVSSVLDGSSRAFTGMNRLALHAIDRLESVKGDVPTPVNCLIPSTEPAGPRKADEERGARCLS